VPPWRTESRIRSGRIVAGFSIVPRSRLRAKCHDGLNAVLRSIPFAPGDEIVMSISPMAPLHSLEGSGARARRHARMRDVPRSATPTALSRRSSRAHRTRLAVVDHITALTHSLPVIDRAPRSRRPGPG
jgi:hypothetical protein